MSKLTTILILYSLKKKLHSTHLYHLYLATRMFVDSCSPNIKIIIKINQPLEKRVKGDSKPKRSAWLPIKDAKPFLLLKRERPLIWPEKIIKNKNFVE